MSNWQIKTLSKIGIFSKGAGISKDSVLEEGLNAVRYGELYTDYDVFVKKIRSHISEKTASEATIIHKGDILFAGSGETIDDIGKSAVYTLNESGYAGGDIIIFRPDDTNEPLFLAQILNSNIARRRLRRLGQGQSIVHIYKSELEKLKFSIPEKQEQQRIVSVLETWDEYLELLDKKIALKEQLKQGLMQQILTGKRRLPGFSEIWKVQKLGDLEDIKAVKLSRGDVISKTDINNNPGDNPIYSSSIHNNGLFGKYSKYMFDEELISWSVDGGGNFFYRPKHKFSVTNVSGYIRVDKNIFNYRFLAYQLQFLHSKKFYDYQFKAHPSVIREEYYILFPSIEEQNEIASILSSVIEEISLLSIKKININTQKKYLLNNLITGKILTPENLSMKGIN